MHERASGLACGGVQRGVQRRFSHAGLRMSVRHAGDVGGLLGYRMGLLDRGRSVGNRSLRSVTDGSTLRGEVRTCAKTLAS